MITFYRFSLLALAILCSNVSLASAGCDQCGCSSRSGKVCKLVCDETELEITCYKSETEEFCIPEPSCRKCKYCDEACGPAGHCGDNCVGSRFARRFVWFTWQPRGAKLACKKKLLAKTVTKKVPTYRWVVVDACSQCGDNSAWPAEMGVDTGCAKAAPATSKIGEVLPVSYEELIGLKRDHPQLQLPPADAAHAGKASAQKDAKGSRKPTVKRLAKLDNVAEDV